MTYMILFFIHAISNDKIKLHDFQTTKGRVDTRYTTCTNTHVLNV